MGIFRRTECQNKGSGQVGDKAMEKGKNSKRSTITKDRRTARQSQGQEDKELKIG